MIIKDDVTKCHFCNVKYTPPDEFGNYPYNFIVVKFYHRHLMYLCDRCVDKLNSYRNGTDIDDYWLPKDAKRCGYPDFPYHKLVDPRKKRRGEE